MFFVSIRFHSNLIHFQNVLYLYLLPVLLSGSVPYTEWISPPGTPWAPVQLAELEINSFIHIKTIFMKSAVVKMFFFIVSLIMNLI